MPDKALFAKFTTSEQMIADNVGKSTSHLSDFWRTKTYVKPEEMVDPSFPSFDQPYQLGQQIFGGSWHDYNTVCIFQIAKCNYRCWYCYVDRQLLLGQEAVDDVQLAHWFTPEEIIGMFKESGKKVLRLSGGEPTLYPNFMTELARWMIGQDSLLWFDTNMSTGKDFFEAWEGYFDLHYTSKPHAGIVGCFKGFCSEDAMNMAGANLDEQFVFAERLIKQRDLEVFFYVPGLVCRGASPSVVKSFFDRMRKDIDEYAPLRTHVLQIKNYSSTEDQWGRYTQNINDGRRVVDVWQRLCRDHYQPEELWLPSHQVKYQYYR